jgi:hypothetical protein
MKCKQMPFVSGTPEIVDRGIRPHVRTMTAMPSKLDIVAMGSAANLEDQNVLVLTSIERAHSGVVLDPNANILQLQIACVPGSEQFA